MRKKIAAKPKKIKLKKVFEEVDLSKVLSFSKSGTVLLDVEELKGVPLILKGKSLDDGVGLKWIKSKGILDLCTSGIGILKIVPVVSNRVEIHVEVPQRVLKR